jgi:acetyltransferase-like isoleucine patch superfamily enzyme
MLFNKGGSAMTEKEKMISGELYDAGDTELRKDRAVVKNMCFEYNKLESSEIIKRSALIKNILGKTGVHVTIEPNFWCDYGYNISVGENFYMNHNGVILDCAKVEFGDNVFIGCNTNLIAPLKVGNNAFIAAGSTITNNVPHSALAIARARQVNKPNYFIT